MGTERAYVVHGSDGLDELTTTGPSWVAAVEDGTVREFQIDPGALGLSPADPAQLLGGEAEANAAALRAVLSGEEGPYRDIACLNAAAALVVAEAAETLDEGLTIARAALDEGRAERTLHALIAVAEAVAP